MTGGTSIVWDAEMYIVVFLMFVAMTMIGGIFVYIIYGIINPEILEIINWNIYGICLIPGFFVGLFIFYIFDRWG